MAAIDLTTERHVSDFFIFSINSLDEEFQLKVFNSTESFDAFETMESIILESVSIEEKMEPMGTPPKQRDALFDVAKGIGILIVLGHHSFSNSARLYSVPHSYLWWTLSFLNRILSFSVPVFLLVSAVLSARTLMTKPQVLPFYKRRLPGVLWPYLAWTVVYWVARMVLDRNAQKIVPSSIFGFPISGPALMVHFKERWLEVVWGKSYFHLYFLVVLVELLILLPLAVKYVRWRNPSFWEVFGTAFALQGAIMVTQHYTALVPYPGSCALWYIGSLLPGAWIGANWSTFKEQAHKWVYPLVGLVAVTGILFLREELNVIHGLIADNYLSNGSLTIYASSLAVLVLIGSIKISENERARKILEPLGKYSLQIYLIHPGVMQLLERQRFTRVMSITHLGPILSPALMLAITIGLILLFRVTRTEKLLFGRS